MKTSRFCFSLWVSDNSDPKPGLGARVSLLQNGKDSCTHDRPFPTKAAKIVVEPFDRIHHNVTMVRSKVRPIMFGAMLSLAVGAALFYWTDNPFDLLFEIGLSLAACSLAAIAIAASLLLMFSRPLVLRILGGTGHGDSLLCRLQNRRRSKSRMQFADSSEMRAC